MLCQRQILKSKVAILLITLVEIVDNNKAENLRHLVGRVVLRLLFTSSRPRAEFKNYIGSLRLK